MRKWELIIQSKLLKIKIKIPSNLFQEKNALKLGEFHNTTGTERIKNIFTRTDGLQNFGVTLLHAE